MRGKETRISVVVVIVIATLRRAAARTTRGVAPLAQTRQSELFLGGFG
jgi:hypothetical protein